MNERIKELIEQATTEEHDGFRYFDREKFAELIVRDCASHLNWVGDDAAGIELLEHFGVEE
jgi:hypothetical protein